MRNYRRKASYPVELLNELELNTAYMKAYVGKVSVFREEVLELCQLLQEDEIEEAKRFARRILNQESELDDIPRR